MTGAETFGRWRMRLARQVERRVILGPTSAWLLCRSGGLDRRLELEDLRLDEVLDLVARIPEDCKVYRVGRRLIAVPGLLPSADRVWTGSILEARVRIVVRSAFTEWAREHGLPFDLRGPGAVAAWAWRDEAEIYSLEASAGRGVYLVEG